MELIGIHGIITLHHIPSYWTDEDFRYWWLPETDKNGQIIRQARISDENKRNRIVTKPVDNLITNAGIAIILNNLSVSGQGNMQPLAQIVSLGNGSITGVTRTDTAVQGDGFATGARKAAASFSIVGFATTLTFNFGTGDAVGSLTNVGLYGLNTSSGQSASTTAATGSLMTHALFNFTKGSTAYALSYVFTLSN